jgi:CRISPR-associated protein Csb2
MPPDGASAPTSFRWRLAGAPGPALTQALRLGEAVRAVVMRAGNRIGLASLPAVFHGAGGAGPHDHAYWLSEDRDGDGRIDHVLVHANAGIPAGVIPALAAAGTVWLGPEAEWSLAPVWMGCPAPGGLFGPSRRWAAATAYVTPRWRTDRHGRERPGLDPEQQLRREIALRGLPPPVSVCWRAHDTGPTFVTVTKTRRAPRDAWQGQPLIRFATQVQGPLAFGFGAHFGLGLLRAIDAV